MSWTLAITGKGGAGKTTLAGLAVRWLGEHGFGPVLAIDADPNSCLDALLGIRVESALGTVREEAKQIIGDQPTSTGGMGKQQLLSLKIQESLIEAENFDLLAMGRPEGPGCYCYANNVLGEAVRRLARHYPSIVLDNEAGLENLSRRIVHGVDHLLFVTDPSARGLTTARRLYDLAEEMEIKTGSCGLVVNRARDDTCLDRARQLFEGTPVTMLGTLPDDGELAARDERGETILTLSADNPVLLAASQMFARITGVEGI